MRKMKSGSSMEHSPQPQSRCRRIWAALCLGIGIVAVGYFLQVQIRSGTPKNRVLLNQPLPSMIVEAAGEDTNLKSFARGLRCVIVFHSPSCRICREMLPALRPFPPELRLILVNESRDQGNSGSIQFPGRGRFSRPASDPLPFFGCHSPANNAFCG